MARYYRRRYYKPKRKYNIENRVINQTIPTQPENGFYQNQMQIVPPSTTEGVRKVTRFTITITEQTTGQIYDSTIYWALVYIPEGAVTSSLFPDSTTLFTPSNYVLASGVNDTNAGPIRISSRIQKNLNAGDQIYLLTAAGANSGSTIRYLRGLIRYAIAYN